MESYLTMWRQCTQIGTQLSSQIDCSLSVPQVSILGPLLFSLYADSFPTVCPDVMTQIYVDDTFIYVNAKTKQQQYLVSVTDSLSPVSL